MKNTYKIMEVNMDTLVPRIIGDTYKDFDMDAGEVLRNLYPDNMVLFDGDKVGDVHYNGKLVVGISDDDSSMPLGDSIWSMARKGNIFIFLKYIDEDTKDSLYFMCEDEVKKRLIYYKLKPLERGTF